MRLGLTDVNPSFTLLLVAVADMKASASSCPVRQRRNGASYSAAINRRAAPTAKGSPKACLPCHTAAPVVPM